MIETEADEVSPSGAEAQIHFQRLIGTTEVVLFPVLPVSFRNAENRALSDLLDFDLYALR